MQREHLPIVILLAGAGLALTWLARAVWYVLPTDGLLVAAVIAAAAGWGAWPTAWLGFGRRPLGQQFSIATALGLGILSTLTLALGVAGLLNSTTVWILLAIGGVAGLARVYLAQHKTEPRDESESSSVTRRSATKHDAITQTACILLALSLVVPLAVTLFGASLPPGLIWEEEANGYDALEYHLQGPREYYDAGRITFLPHNVYTSFPQQMEMQYLLLMHLAGGAHAAAIASQLLHAACGILAVLALACWTRAGAGRWAVAAIAGTTPWLTQVGCLAYVENGMLLFAAVAAGLVVDQIRTAGVLDWRAVLTAGICAGLAGGCKYTALVFVAVSLALAWLMIMRAPLRVRLTRVAIFGVGTLLAFCPWLIRNAAFTGNPVYPFAYEWFGGAAWSAEQAEQWSTAHAVPAESDTLPGRLAIAGRELFGSIDAQTQTFRLSLFGPGIFVLGLVGLLMRRSRRGVLLAAWSVLIAVGWIALTFIPGRFAMPLIVPLALLAGESFGLADSQPGTTTRRWHWPVLLLVVAGVPINDALLASRLRHHARRWEQRTGVPLRMLIGQTRFIVDDHLLNKLLPADAHAWLVGDAAVFYVDRRIHYTVTFSRDPWIEFAASGATPEQCIAWLREQDATHVVFAWAEIDRLRNTYGFAAIVTPDWVARLETAGLRRVRPEDDRIDARATAVYEIPPIKGGRT